MLLQNSSVHETDLNTENGRAGRTACNMPASAVSFRSGRTGLVEELQAAAAQAKEKAAIAERDGNPAVAEVYRTMAAARERAAAKLLGAPMPKSAPLAQPRPKMEMGSAIPVKLPPPPPIVVPVTAAPSAALAFPVRVVQIELPNVVPPAARLQETALPAIAPRAAARWRFAPTNLRLRATANRLHLPQFPLHMPTPPARISAFMGSVAGAWGRHRRAGM